MNKLRDDLLIWLGIAAVILLGRVSYAWGGLLLHMDFTLIAAALLVFSGRIYTAYAAAAIAGALADLITMPFFGFHFFSYAAAVTALWIMTLNLYRDNYITKVFIAAAAITFMWVFYTLLVIVFHWQFRIHYFSARALPEIAATTAAAAVIFKMLEIYEERLKKWLKTTSRKI